MRPRPRLSAAAADPTTAREIEGSLLREVLLLDGGGAGGISFDQERAQQRADLWSLANAGAHGAAAPAAPPPRRSRSRRPSLEVQAFGVGASPT